MYKRFVLVTYLYVHPAYILFIKFVEFNVYQPQEFNSFVQNEKKKYKHVSITSILQVTNERIAIINKSVIETVNFYKEKQILKTRRTFSD